MVMPRVLTIRPGRRNAHVPQAEIELQLRRHRCPVLEIGEVDLRSRRRSGEALAWGLCDGDAASCNAGEQQRCDRAPVVSCYDFLEHRARPVWLLSNKSTSLSGGLGRGQENVNRPMRQGGD